VVSCFSGCECWCLAFNCLFLFYLLIKELLLWHSSVVELVLRSDPVIVHCDSLWTLSLTSYFGRIVQRQLIAPGLCPITTDQPQSLTHL